MIEEKNVFLFEFKFTDINTLPKDKKRRKNVVARQALKQIKTNKYYERFIHIEKQDSLQTSLQNPNILDQGTMRRIYLIGAEFIDKNIGDWVVEEYL